MIEVEVRGLILLALFNRNRIAWSGRILFNQSVSVGLILNQR